MYVDPGSLHSTCNLKVRATCSSLDVTFSATPSSRYFIREASAEGSQSKVLRITQQEMTPSMHTHGNSIDFIST